MRVKRMRLVFATIDTNVRASTIVDSPAPATIIGIDLDLAHVESYSQSGLFRAAFTEQEVLTLTALAKAKITEQSGQPEVLQRAQAKAGDVIIRLLESAGAQRIEITFGAA